MSKKISYLVSTMRPPHDIKECLDSILTLPNHNCEIIICSPAVKDGSHTINGYQIKTIQDTELSGSVNAFNSAYKQSDGDYICLMIEDLAIPPDFLNVLDWMKSDFMKNKVFKIINLSWDGGPGLYTYGHDDLPDGVSLWDINNSPISNAIKPYSIIPLPFIDRETIENKLNGVIFNPIFKHHYVDHWLGIFASKNETFHPNKWRCPIIGRYKLIKRLSYTNPRYDAHDFKTLNSLANEFVMGQTKYA